MTTIVAKIQRRRGAAAAWTSNNPTLLAGEEGHESDTGKYKVGDGTTAWTSLAYFFDPSDYGDVTGPASSTDHALARFDGVGGKTLQDSTATLSDAGALTLNNGTLTADAPVLDVSQTWNDAAVAFTGIKANITDTASAAASNLLDLQVGGVSRVSIGKSGATRLVSSGLSGFTKVFEIDGFSVGANGFVQSAANGRVAARSFNAQSGAEWCLLGGNASAGFGSLNSLVEGVRIRDAAYYSWSSTNNVQTGASDLSLYRDAADTLAQRRTTNAQTYRLYNTFTNADNYERLAFTWTTNLAEIKTEAAGTGTLRDLSIGSTGGKLAFLGATPVARPAHVADADTAHALNATFSDTEVEAALNALGTKLNSVLAALRAFGLLSTS